MAGNKKAFLDQIRKDLNTLDKGNESIDIIVDLISKMTDQQFEDYIARLRNGVSETPDYSKPREIIPIVLPNTKKTNITVGSNLALAKKWGHEFFEKVWMVDPVSKARYLPNRRYALLELPMVRQSQTLEKGLSYSDNTSLLDNRTNQAADSVKGSSFSGPELQSVLSQGRESVATEFMKYRGGDDQAFRHMSKVLMETGEYAQKQYPLPTRAKSTDVAAIYLKASHLDTDL